MYINVTKIRIKKITNGIRLFLGIFGLILFGATAIFVTLEGDSRKDVEIFFYIATLISILLIVKSIMIRKLIGSIFFYSRYFEGDLDGKIKVAEMVEVIGKSEKKIYSELKKT